MKTNKMTILIIAAFAAVFLLLIPMTYAGEEPMAPSANQPQLAPEQIKVMGKIITHTDESGTILGYFLLDAGGQSVAVSSQGKGEQLQNMVGKRVEVIGTLEESQGNRAITVTEFKEIE